MNRRTFLRAIGLGGASAALTAAPAFAHHRPGHGDSGLGAGYAPAYERLGYEWQGVDQLLDDPGGRNFIHYNKVAERFDPDGVLARYGDTGLTVGEGVYQVNAGIAFKSETTYTKARWFAIHETGSDVRQPLAIIMDQAENVWPNDSGDAALAVSTVFVGPGSVEAWALVSNGSQGVEAVAPSRSTFLEVVRLA